MIKTRKLELAVCTCSFLVCLILLISHTYNDIVITTRHGINFWNVLLEGKFLDFYKVSRIASGNDYYTAVQGCAYNILVYIVFAVWNLPLYLLERFAGVDVMNAIPCLVYSKLLVVACTAVTAAILRKLLEALHVSKEHHSLMVYLYLSSTLLVTVVFLTGQYDILSLPFQMLGLLAFIKGKDRAFVFWFGIAFCFKYFAAIIFLPLLLLRHKKAAAWVRNLVMLLVPVLITKLPFLLYGLLAQTDRGTGGEALAGRIMTRMLSSSNIGAGINPFFVVYICLLVWCYLRQENSSSSGHSGVWVCMVAYGAFFGLLNAYPYWSILLAPFVVLAIAMEPKHMYINLILETAGYAGLIVVNMLRYNWVYFGHTLKPMIWSRILEGTRFHIGYGNSRVNEIICQLNTQGDIHAVVNSVFLGAMIALAYTTYPARNPSGSQKLQDPRGCCDILLLRLLINSGICLFPLLAVFI